MRRREILIGAAGAALASVSARAQRAERPRRIAALIPYPVSDAQSVAHMAVFRAALADVGWRDWDNLQIDMRWWGTEVGGLIPAARDIVASQPAAILVRSTAGTAAL